MFFINKGNAVKIRLGKPREYYWVTIKKGEKMDLPKEIGKKHNLEEINEDKEELPKVTEGQIGKTSVETKQINHSEKQNDNQYYFKKLIGINGIGEKTALDIIERFPDEQKLIEAIKDGKRLPFRDDIEKKLREEYGRS